MVVRKTLPVQLKTGIRPVKSKFEEARNYGHEGRRSGFMKPVGGMWTSTYETAFEDGWPAWCIGEDFRLDDLKKAYLLEPVECNVIELAGFDECHEFMVRYGKQLYSMPGPEKDLRLERFADPDGVYARAHEHFDTPSAVCPTWEEVMEDADCVRLLTPRDWNVRLGPYLHFNGWDCESTVWLRWKFAGAARKVDLSAQLTAV